MSIAVGRTPCRGVLPAHGAVASRRPARRGGRLHCRADAATRSLEQAVRVLNKVISIAGSPKNRAKVDGEQKAAKPAKPRWVAFTGTGSAKVDAPGSGAPGRSLADYLALPVSQYSLLDPKFVERLDDESFRVTVPLDTVTGVQVRPQVLVRVSVDPSSGSVTFSSETVTLGDPALDKELALQLRATLGGVPAGDRAAFRRLARRRTPAWAPHPQPGAAADAIDAPEAAAAAASAQAAETAGSAGLAAAEAEPAVGDPLASVEDFRPLQPEAIKAAMAGSPPGGALSAHVADNGSSGGADAAASSGSSGIAGSSGNGAAVDIAMAVASGGGGCESSILMADRSGNGAAEQPPHAGADAVAASDSAARAVAADAAGNTALSVAESTPQQLAARVDLRVSLNVPPVLRVVPRPLLGYASGLVLKVALQALLPSFLQLLAQDFTAWSTGDPKRGSAGGGLLELADFGGGGGDGESGEAATSIPEDWQPCTKQGQPVAAASADL